MAATHPLHHGLNATPVNQNSAPVLEFRCLYTGDLRKKQKKWQDGRLKFHTFNRKVMVYDDRSNFVGDAHWREDYDLEEGSELELERGSFLVEVADFIIKRDQDLTELVEKPIKDKENRAKARASILGSSPARPHMMSKQAHPTTPGGPRLRPKPLTTLLGSSTGHYGRAMIPIMSPYEQRQHALLQTNDTPPLAKRQRREPPPSSGGYAQNLTGATLTLSSRSTSTAPRKLELSRPRMPKVCEDIANIDLTGGELRGNEDSQDISRVTSIIRQGPSNPAQPRKRAVREQSPPPSYARNLTGAALDLTSNFQLTSSRTPTRLPVSRSRLAAEQGFIDIDVDLTQVPRSPSSVVTESQHVRQVGLTTLKSQTRERSKDGPIGDIKANRDAAEVSSYQTSRLDMNRRSLSGKVNPRNSSRQVTLQGLRASDSAGSHNHSTDDGPNGKSKKSSLPEGHRDSSGSCRTLRRVVSAGDVSISDLNSEALIPATSGIANFNSAEQEMRPLRIKSKPNTRKLRSNPVRGPSSEDRISKSVQSFPTVDNVAAVDIKQRQPLRIRTRSRKIKLLSSKSASFSEGTEVLRERPSATVNSAGALKTPEASQTILQLASFVKAQDQRLQDRKRERSKRRASQNNCSPTQAPCALAPFINEAVNVVVEGNDPQDHNETDGMLRISSDESLRLSMREEIDSNVAASPPQSFTGVGISKRRGLVSSGCGDSVLNSSPEGSPAFSMSCDRENVSVTERNEQADVGCITNGYDACDSNSNPPERKSSTPQMNSNEKSSLCEAEIPPMLGTSGPNLTIVNKVQLLNHHTSTPHDKVENQHIRIHKPPASHCTADDMDTMLHVSICTGKKSQPEASAVNATIIGESHTSSQKPTSDANMEILQEEILSETRILTETSKPEDRESFATLSHFVKPTFLARSGTTALEKTPKYEATNRAADDTGPRYSRTFSRASIMNPATRGRRAANQSGTSFVLGTAVRQNLFVGQVPGLLHGVQSSARSKTGTSTAAVTNVPDAYVVQPQLFAAAESGPWSREASDLLEWRKPEADV